MSTQTAEQLYQALLQLLPPSSEHEREETELALDEAVDVMVKGKNGVFAFPSTNISVVQNVITTLNRCHLDVTAVVPTDAGVWMTWKVDY
jgi:hypothetical protein